MLPDDRLHLGRPDDFLEPLTLGFIASLVNYPEQPCQGLRFVNFGK